MIKNNVSKKELVDLVESCRMALLTCQTITHTKSECGFDGTERYFDNLLVAEALKGIAELGKGEKK